jgi:hypothetical protein
MGITDPNRSLAGDLFGAVKLTVFSPKRSLVS